MFLTSLVFLLHSQIIIIRVFVFLIKDILYDETD